MQPSIQCLPPSFNYGPLPAPANLWSAPPPPHANLAQGPFPASSFSAGLPNQPGSSGWQFPQRFPAANPTHSGALSGQKESSSFWQDQRSFHLHPSMSQVSEPMQNGFQMQPSRAGVNALEPLQQQSDYMSGWPAEVSPLGNGIPSFPPYIGYTPQTAPQAAPSVSNAGSDHSRDMTMHSKAQNPNQGGATSLLRSTNNKSMVVQQLVQPSSDKKRKSPNQKNENAAALCSSMKDVLGPKPFASLRTLMLRQQSTFVQQLFELHKLVQVQKLLVSEIVEAIQSDDSETANAVNQMDLSPLPSTSNCKEGNVIEEGADHGAPSSSFRSHCNPHVSGSDHQSIPKTFMPLAAKSINQPSGKANLPSDVMPGASPQQDYRQHLTNSIGSLGHLPRAMRRGTSAAPSMNGSQSIGQAKSQVSAPHQMGVGASIGRPTPLYLVPVGLNGEIIREAYPDPSVQPTVQQFKTYDDEEDTHSQDQAPMSAPPAELKDLIGGTWKYSQAPPQQQQTKSQQHNDSAFHKVAKQMADSESMPAGSSAVSIHRQADVSQGTQGSGWDKSLGAPLATLTIPVLPPLFATTKRFSSLNSEEKAPSKEPSSSAPVDVHAAWFERHFKANGVPSAADQAAHPAVKENLMHQHALNVSVIPALASTAVPAAVNGDAIAPNQTSVKPVVRWWMDASATYGNLAEPAPTPISNNDDGYDNNGAFPHKKRIKYGSIEPGCGTDLDAMRPAVLTAPAAGNGAGGCGFQRFKMPRARRQRSNAGSNRISQGPHADYKNANDPDSDNSGGSGTESQNMRNAQKSRPPTVVNEASGLEFTKKIKSAAGILLSLSTQSL